MTFADKSRYDRTFQQVTHKGGESAINYIKKNQNAQALSVSVGNSYAEYQIMHTFLDNFHLSGKYSAQLASHQEELRREELYPDQKCLNISSLQTEYLNLDNFLSGSSRQNEKANSARMKCSSIFDQDTFPLFSIPPCGYLTGLSIFHFDGNYPEMCA